MKLLDKLKTIIFCLILLTGVSAVYATSSGTWTGPTTTPTTIGSGPLLLAPLSTSQYKIGGLALGTNSTSNLTNYNLDVAGKILSNGLAVVGGGADILGSIKSSALSYTKTNSTDPDKRICADTSGKLIICTGVILPRTFTYTSGYAGSFTLPSNMVGNIITIELQGGDGGSYSSGSTPGDAGASSLYTSVTATSGLDTWIIFAGGGKKGTSVAKGAGGIVVAPWFLAGGVSQANKYIVGDVFTPPSPDVGAYVIESTPGVSGSTIGQGGKGGNIKITITDAVPGQTYQLQAGTGGTGGPAGSAGFIKINYFAVD